MFIRAVIAYIKVKKNAFLTQHSPNMAACRLINRASLITWHKALTPLYPSSPTKTPFGSAMNVVQDFNWDCVGDGLEPKFSNMSLDETWLGVGIPILFDP